MAEMPGEQPGHEQLRQRDRRRRAERQAVERGIEVVVDQGEDQELHRARDDEHREDRRGDRRPEPAEDADRLVDPVETNEVADEPGAIERQISPPGTDRVHQQDRRNPPEPGAQGGLRHEPGAGEDAAPQDRGNVDHESTVLALTPAPCPRPDSEPSVESLADGQLGRGSRTHRRDEGRPARHEPHGRPPSMAEQRGRRRRDPPARQATIDPAP